MKSLQIKDKTLTLIQRSIPDRQEGEALIRVLMAGICQTDLELLQGYQSFAGVPGHEFVGRVEESSDRPEFVGQRVVADINVGCGLCSWCLQGDQRHCPQRSVIGLRGHSGAFAEYLTAPTGNLHLVPEGLSDREAVFAEPLAAALEISQQIHIKSTDRVAVLGDGKLGLLTALALRVFSPHLVLIGKHPRKLELAAAQGISTHLIESGQNTIAKAGPGPFDILVEATGNPQGIDSALDYVRPEGTIAIKTTSHARTELDLARITVNEINMLGSRCGDLDLALSFLERKHLDVLPLIEAIYPYADFQEAFDLAGTKGSKKVLIDLQSSIP
ncbi:MAG: alcohol dehydrogenase catalytic domain-containing protein [Desulfohalobiaceae bacterium]|nr:alcohol dehydrogenase catalytic domain-containing protein [Desulfohalobiaceae bacterium]